MTETVRDHPALERRLDASTQAPESPSRSGRRTVRHDLGGEIRRPHAAQIDRCAQGKPQGMPAMPSMGYQPALDGLRALSVIAVMFYHAGFSWMHGGFFGVEVFFVVSGFLITSLLLDELDQTSHTNLPQFWMRRARRLLPALFTVLAATAVWAVFAGTDEQQSQLRRDLPWATFYGGNWGQIIGDVPTTAAIRRCSGTSGASRSRSSGTCSGRWRSSLVRTRLSRPGLPARWRLGGVMLWTFVLHGSGPGQPPARRSPCSMASTASTSCTCRRYRASGIVLGAAAAFVAAVAIAGSRDLPRRLAARWRRPARRRSVLGCIARW